ncbi:hypothetical protein ACF0H5_007391 [Mactra antiquata]
MDFFILMIVAYYILEKGSKVATGNTKDDIGCIFHGAIPWDKEIHLDNNSRATCKNECMTKYRYAGMKNKFYCLCEDDIDDIGKTRHNSAQCSMECPNMPNETCGGRNYVQVYDTWRCQNGAWCNGSSCKDYNSTYYECLCAAGFRGKHCNEIQTTVTSKRTKIQTTGTVKTLMPSRIDNKNKKKTSKTEDYPQDDITSTTEIQEDKDKDTKNLLVYISTPILGSVFFINCVGLLIWCIHKQITQRKRMNSEIQRNGGIQTAVQGTAIEMLPQRNMAHENQSYSIMPEENPYDCIHDIDSNVYENVNFANRCMHE